MSMSIGMVYAKWKLEAERRGWKVPASPEPFGQEAWVRYWVACDEYARDPSKGRPVVPHRSAA